MTFNSLFKLAAFSSVMCLALLACDKEQDLVLANSTANTMKKSMDLPLLASIENTIRILPLGDSRVEGNRPDFESYRYELWKILVANDLPIDFVGTRQDEADYELIYGRPFDRDHEGTSGAITEDILETLAQLDENNGPDITLLGIGGNDLTGAGLSVEEAISNIEGIIDLLQSSNPNMTIFLEQIAPAHSDFMGEILRQTLHQFNTQIVIIAENKSNSESKIIVVNMATDWSDDYMADEVHYNEVGAKIVADRYFKAMQDFYKEAPVGVE